MTLAALDPAAAADPPRHLAPTSALDALLHSGAIGEREHAAGLAYGRLRARWLALFSTLKATRRR